MLASLDTNALRSVSLLSAYIEKGCLLPLLAKPQPVKYHKTGSILETAAERARNIATVPREPVE